MPPLSDLFSNIVVSPTRPPPMSEELAPPEWPRVLSPVDPAMRLPADARVMLDASGSGQRMEK
jgi:hypothetical protein